MKPGTKLQLAQKDDLATHLLPAAGLSTKALCGTYVAYPSYSVPAAVNKAGVLYFYDGSQALRYVDCKRCLKAFNK